MSESLSVKVHVQGIKGSGLTDPGETPSALFGAILEVDGQVIELVNRVELDFKEDFLTVKAHLIPGSFEVVTHDSESWPELLRALKEDRTVRDMQGRLIARTGEGSN